tara:strand:- start:99 stop:269 length:171 start_codon:yes stop_codon:yes gene_type:complete
MGIEDEAESALNIAGYWTVGVSKGFFIVIVPLAAVSLAFGMAIKVMKAGVKIGRIE